MLWGIFPGDLPLPFAEMIGAISTLGTSLSPDRAEWFPAATASHFETTRFSGCRIGGKFLNRFGRRSRSRRQLAPVRHEPHDLTPEGRQ